MENEWTLEDVEQYERDSSAIQRYHAVMQSWQEYEEDK